MIFIFIMDLIKYEEIINKNKIVFITFSAPWCGPCNAIKKDLEDIKKENEKQNIIYITVDIDKSYDIAEIEDIKAIPSFIIYKENKIIYNYTGSDINEIKKGFKLISIN